MPNGKGYRIAKYIGTMTGSTAGSAAGSAGSTAGKGYRIAKYIGTLTPTNDTPHAAPAAGHTPRVGIMMPKSTWGAAATTQAPTGG